MLHNAPHAHIPADGLWNLLSQPVLWGALFVVSLGVFTFLSMRNQPWTAMTVISCSGIYLFGVVFFISLVFRLGVT